MAVEIADAACKLIAVLLKVRDTKKHNDQIALVVDQFVVSLRKNVDQLTQHLPEKSTPWAIESLKGDLSEVAKLIDECLEKGYFHSLWNAFEIKRKLQSLQQRLTNAFQMKLLITSLEVAISADKRTRDFELNMLRLSQAESSQTRAELQVLLQPLVLGMKRQDESLQSFYRLVRGSDDTPPVDWETEKFVEDLMATLDGLVDVDVEQYKDPLTNDLMIDPVKCSDGRTYDRWTIIDQNVIRWPFGEYQSEDFIIMMDDVDVRERLFEKFSHQVRERHEKRRKDYREQAVMVAKEGHHAEAVEMLEQVLKFYRRDEECLTMLKKCQHEVRKMASAFSTGDSQPSTSRNSTRSSQIQSWLDNSEPETPSSSFAHPPNTSEQPLNRPLLPVARSMELVRPRETGRYTPPIVLAPPSPQRIPERRTYRETKKLRDTCFYAILWGGDDKPCSTVTAIWVLCAPISCVTLSCLLCEVCCGYPDRFRHGEY